VLTTPLEIVRAGAYFRRLARACQILRTRTNADAPSRSATRSAYVERINLAVDHVLTHLDGPLRLVDVARAAHLSPFHFHRVFQGMTGETLADFVKRVRLDKAVSMMAHAPAGRDPGARAARPPLSQIAAACGFSSSSDFSRSFKQRFGVAPSAFDVAAWRESHRAAFDARGVGAALALRRLPEAGNPDRFRVRIRDLPARTVAYIRVTDPYKPTAVVDAAQRLVAWAESRDLADNPWLGFQWESPELVPLEQCVYHAAVVADRFTAEGEVGRFRFPAMTVAQVDVRGDIHLELRALRWLYGTWLPRSGYVPDDHPCFEAWIGHPFAHGFERFELAVQLPVRRGW
jgi:AraC family transcriptional regulator